MANILDPNEDYNPKNGLRVIYTKLKEVIRVLNTAVANIATNTSDIAALEIQAGSYKKYVALLTQTTVSTTSGLLVVGKTYVIGTLVAGDNFANVGYVSDGVNFVATATTPTIWANGTVVVNVTDSAPVATVLENTLGEVPTWTYDSVGYYKLSITGGFDVTKTFVNVGTSYNQSGGFGNPLFRTYVYTDNKIWVDSFTESLGAHIATNGVLYATPIEIRVYP